MDPIAGGMCENCFFQIYSTMTFPVYTLTTKAERKDRVVVNLKQ